jgi:hypothetical protein
VLVGVAVRVLAWAIHWSMIVVALALIAVGFYVAVSGSFAGR